MLAMQLVDIIHGATTGAVVWALLLAGMLIQQRLSIRRMERALKKTEEETVSFTRTESCPCCGEKDRIDKLPSKDDTIRYCNACKFQWSTELGVGMLIALASDHDRERRAKQ